MAVTTQVHNTQTESIADALWTLIQGQKKSVQKILAKRLNEQINAKKEPKAKMTEQEFYAKLDESIASTESGPVYTMGENETGEEFINRLLTTTE